MAGLLGLPALAGQPLSVHTFDIRRQPLREALMSLALVANQRLIFRPSLVEGKQGSPVRGALDTGEALARLLADTDLAYEITGDGVVLIRRAAPGERRGEGPPTPARMAEPERALVLEEIVVTAQKRPEFLQAIPVVAQALPGEELQRAGVTDFSNIAKVAPNLQVSQGAGAPILSVRGIRANAFGAGSESPTAVHLDGNYISEVVGLTGMFFDLERVEIMPGPQGTLFGRNAAAAAVNIVTRKPALDLAEMSASVEAGSHDLRRVGGAINAPLGADAAVRLAGYSFQRGGYYENDLDDASQWSVRAGVLWLPDADSSLTLQADYARNRPKGSSDNLVQAGNPGNGLSVPAARDNSSLYGDAALSQQDQQFWGANLLYERDIDLGTFSVQAAHREVRQSDYLYGQQNLAHPTEYGHSGSLEARLLSPTGGWFDWVAGIYYFRENKYGGTGVLDPLDSAAFDSRIEILGQSTEAVATFGQATIALRDRLRVTLGGRANYDRKSSSSVERVIPDLVYYQPTTTASWGKITWKAGLSFDLSPDTLLFGHVATGYKSGSFAYGPAPEIVPQDVIAYELGAKSRWFDERLEINVSGYYSDYRNMEQAYTLPVPGTFASLIAVTNTGGAEVYGMEGTIDWLPSMHDRLRVQLNYLHARYQGFDLTAYGLRDFSGLAPPNTPAWSGNVTHTHWWPVGAGRLELSTKLQFATKRNLSGIGGYSEDGVPFQQGSYVAGDIAVTWAGAGERWSVTGYVNNISDKIIYLTGTYAPSRGYNVYAQQAAPRTWGLLFSYRR